MQDISHLKLQLESRFNLTKASYAEVHLFVHVFLASTLLMTRCLSLLPKLQLCTCTLW